jgi:hypothetical protein
MGVGPGRGICCLFVMLGSVAALSALVSLLYEPLGTLEHSLPDAVLVVEAEDEDERDEWKRA